MIWQLSSFSKRRLVVLQFDPQRHTVYTRTPPIANLAVSRECRAIALESTHHYMADYYNGLGIPLHPDLDMIYLREPSDEATWLLAANEHELPTQTPFRRYLKPLLEIVYINFQLHHLFSIVWSWDLFFLASEGDFDNTTFVKDLAIAMYGAIDTRVVAPTEDDMKDQWQLSRNISLAIIGGSRYASLAECEQAKREIRLLEESGGIAEDSY